MEAILEPIRTFANSGIYVHHFIALAMLLFLVGLYGVMTRRNIVAILMSVEIMLNAAMLVFVSSAAYSTKADASATGPVFALFIVAIAAAEVAVGLAIFINVFRSKGGVVTEDLMEMKN